MTKLILTALATALVLAVSPARAFDGNDRLLSVDKYQALPANNAYRVAEYRPYGSQVGAFEQLGEAIDSIFSPEPVYVQETVPVGYGYRPLDGTPRNSSYYLRRRETRHVSHETARRETHGYRVPVYSEKYRGPTCRSAVTASTQLARGGLKWAKWSATNVWRATVRNTYGEQYTTFSAARSVRWECDGAIVAKCTVTAVPCRGY